MSIVGIITATAVVGGTGLLIGLFLGIASIRFKVEVDEKEEAVLSVLPGNNCGGCGFAGCAGLAAAIAKLQAPVNACPVGGDPVAKQVGEIMGIEAQEGVRLTAFVACSGNCNQTSVDYEYHGLQDCRMLSFVPNGGPKSCNYGCLGYGSCVEVCPFDAIHIVDGIAVVDKDACKACGKCVEICPKNLIELVPSDAESLVACSSKEKGPSVMKVCKTGCIGCGLCKKVCPAEAITVENFLAHIDQEKCTGCGACKEKCPKQVIV